MGEVGCEALEGGGLVGLGCCLFFVGWEFVGFVGGEDAGGVGVALVVRVVFGIHQQMLVECW